MSDETQSQEQPSTDALPANYSKIIFAAIGAVVVLSLITIVAYQYASKRTSATVLPGGTTYLGPDKETETQNTPVPAPSVKFTVSPTTPWIEYKSKIFGYTFSYPNTLTLVLFPNDPTDSAAISWNNIPAQQNILVRVADLNNTEKMSFYINKPKIEYATNWWKQFGGLKGVKSVDEFVNAKGMKGFKAKYINHANQTPNDDVFFEVPGRAELMVRFGNGVLDNDVFNRIIDTFNWTEKAAVPVPTAQPTATQ